MKYFRGRGAAAAPETSVLLPAKRGPPPKGKSGGPLAPLTGARADAARQGPRRRPRKTNATAPTPADIRPAKARAPARAARRPNSRPNSANRHTKETHPNKNAKPDTQPQHTSRRASTQKRRKPEKQRTRPPTGGPPRLSRPGRRRPALCSLDSRGIIRDVWGGGGKPPLPKFLGAE